MKKLITICDYCGKQIEDVYSLIPVRLLNADEGIWKMDPHYSVPDMCLGCMDNILNAISPEELSRKAAAGADPEEESVALKQQEPAEEVQDQEPAEEDAANKQQAGTAVKETSKRGKVDHGRIVALYTANPPRSIEWIADDCRCSQQTVINHLKQEGIYKTLQERRDGKQEEEE